MRNSQAVPFVLFNFPIYEGFIGGLGLVGRGVQIFFTIVFSWEIIWKVNALWATHFA